MIKDLFMYNLHDCDIVLPIINKENSLIIQFILSRHFQHNKIIEKFSVYNTKEFPYIFLEVEFTNICNLTVKETIEKRTTKIEKQISINDFDKEFFLDDVVINNNSFDSAFSCKEKFGEVCFNFENAVILKETCISSDKSDELMDI